MVGLVLLFVGISTLVQPTHVPGRPPPIEGRGAPPPTPAVSVSNGLYFKTVVWARGGWGVMYLRCFVLDEYVDGAWTQAGRGGAASYGDGVVTVGTGPFKWGGELNLSAPLMGGCVPVATPSVDGLRLGSVRLLAPGAGLGASQEGLYVFLIGGRLTRVVSYYGPGEGRLSAAYLEVPPGLKPVLASLAANITAGCVDVACKVARIKSYLSRFEYGGTLDAPWPSIPLGVDPVLWFLQEGRRGVCIHFASAFVLLARAAGVPARLVVGYVSDGAVSSQWSLVSFSPHAWAEYFDGVGWVGVEVTPGAGTNAPALPLPAPVVNPPSLPQPPSIPAPQLPAPPGDLPVPAVYGLLGVFITAGAAYLLKRRVTVGVGEVFRLERPRGFWVYVNKRRVSRVPAALVFDKPGVYVVRAGPFVYLVRVVDYKTLAGRLFTKLLKKLQLPPSATPREVAAAYPEYREVAYLVERIRFGPSVGREDWERLKQLI